MGWVASCAQAVTVAAAWANISFGGRLGCRRQRTWKLIVQGSDAVGNRGSEWWELRKVDGGSRGSNSTEQQATLFLRGGQLHHPRPPGPRCSKGRSPGTVAVKTPTLLSAFLPPALMHTMPDWKTSDHHQ
ncbi:hypothetical protein QBC34DRAFT_96561 [Podospora aff. communis PSN243]|uniref:Secreted protein n=1 Tax=Podospora aff. communis PSN243 TaxID=3040156 RepID=A0AAV9GMB9_9PEZI|nr:hypothetical protein QBC34DRAFT_96561 [Podospora aff. communis PSN243]